MDWLTVTIVIAIPILFGWFQRSAKKGKAAIEGGAQVYSRVIGIRILYWMGTILFLSLFIYSVIHSSEESSLRTEILFAVLAVLSYLATIDEIRISNEGLEKHLAWGVKRFPWSRIHSIEVKKYQNYTTYTVWAEDGKITLDGWYTDIDSLVGEIRKRSDDSGLTGFEA